MKRHKSPEAPSPCCQSQTHQWSCADVFLLVNTMPVQVISVPLLISFLAGSHTNVLFPRGRSERKNVCHTMSPDVATAPRTGVYFYITQDTVTCNSPKQPEKGCWPTLQFLLSCLSRWLEFLWSELFGISQWKTTLRRILDLARGVAKASDPRGDTVNYFTILQVSFSFLFTLFFPLSLWK